MLDFDEYTLIERTQQGDAEAFTPLVSKHQHRLYTHIVGRIKDPETAKDLCQEAWLKAFLAIKTFRGDAAFYSWVYRIAENLCIDFLRKQKTSQDLAPLHAVDERQIIGPHPDPHQYLARKELQQELKTAIGRLPPTRKRVFLLRYGQELPIKAIARQLQRSEGTVKTHLYKAVRQLRELLTPYLKDHTDPDFLPENPTL